MRAPAAPACVVRLTSDLDSCTATDRGRARIEVRRQTDRRTQAQQVHPSSPCSSTPAPTQRMDGECCKGVPAALQPVQCGSHSMCVTVCDGCAAGRSTVDMPSTSRPSTVCAAQRLDACAATPAPTDCCSFVRQEAAQARSASTARPTRSSWAHCSRCTARGERSLVGAVAAAVARCCGPCSAKLSYGSPTACMANPGRVCFTSMICADMVGV